MTRRRSRLRFGRRLCNFDQKLTEVSPFKQADQRLRRVLQTLDHVLAVFDPPAFDPAGHLGIKSRALVGEFALNETSYREAFRKDLPHHNRQAIGPWERGDA